MRIAVMGSGGVGGYFGARLAQGGCEVAFVARGAHLAAMRERGLVVRSQLGDVHLHSVRATDDPASLGPVDLALIGVKLWDTEAAARAVAPIVGPETAVLSLQNGVVKDDILRQVLGDRPVMGGILLHRGRDREPGRHRAYGHHGPDGVRRVRRQQLGEGGGLTRGLPAGRRGRRAEPRYPPLDLGEVRPHRRLQRHHGRRPCPHRPIRANPQARAFLLDAMREAVAVGRALGVDLPPDYAEARLAFCDGLPAEMTSSTLTDLEQGNRLETPWLSGVVVELGRKAGIPTPSTGLSATSWPSTPRGWAGAPA